MGALADETLATVQDVQGLLGHAVSGEDAARLPNILIKLSELFRREAGQHFTPKRSTVRRKVTGGEIYLSQWPAVAVHSVTTLSGRPVEFNHVGQWVYVPGFTSEAMLLVDYEHGGETPDLVRDTVADAARQILSIAPEAVAGITQGQETTGPMTESSSYATWAQGGSTRLSPEDRVIARSFRRRPGNVWVMGS